MPPSRKLENYFHKKGFNFIAGLDEVGVGSLAGPVLAAAAIFPRRIKIKGIDDSKRLSVNLRNKLFKKIVKSALGIGIGIVDEKIIDKINILHASHLAMQLALCAIRPRPDFVMIDGKYSIKTSIPQVSLKGGDAKCTNIAAASIIAKVIRDKIMDKFDLRYPRYKFKCHKGYGTKKHMKMINSLGPSPIHRRSYSPVRTFYESQIPLDFKQ